MNVVQHIKANQFETEVMRSTVPVLVDFYADWCGPCRMMGPVLERVATQVAGRGKVVKVNVDEAPELAARYGISSIPALVVLHGGKVVAKTVGMATVPKLVSMIDEALALSPAGRR